MSAFGFGPQHADGPFLPTEFEIPKDPVISRELISRRERITASTVNIREIAIYDKVENITGQQFFNPVNSPTGQFQIKRYTFRLTFDLVALNGGNIPIGTTSIALQSNPSVATPTLIQYVNGLVPVHGFGAATAGSTFYFVNDPLLSVHFVNTSTISQTIVITNNTGSSLTQMYWTFEYIKN